MGDPYRIYFANTDRDNVARPSFPGYLSTETPSLLFNTTLASTDPPRSYASDLLQRDIKPLTTTEPPRSYASDLLQRDIKPLTTTEPPWSYASDLLQRDIKSLTTGVYAADETAGMRFRPEPVVGVSAGASMKGYPSLLEAPSLVSQRQDVGAVSIGPSVPTDMSKERPPSSFINGDGLPAVKGESNVLFVDGLPTDCTRREVGHLFRPFIGFKELKLVHKEPRRNGDKAMVLCFVEFVDPKCALTAMEALQGYKFDDKKPDSLALKIQYAHFPFCHPADGKEPRIGIPR